MVLAAWFFMPATALAQKADAPAPAMFKFGETWEWKQVDNRTGKEVQKSSITVVNMSGQLRFFNGESDESIDGWFRGRLAQALVEAMARVAALPSARSGAWIRSGSGRMASPPGKAGRRSGRL